jgi:hypothetical protein
MEDHMNNGYALGIPAGEVNLSNWTQIEDDVWERKGNWGVLRLILKQDESGMCTYNPMFHFKDGTQQPYGTAFGGSDPYFAISELNFILVLMDKAAAVSG